MFEILQPSSQPARPEEYGEFLISASLSDDIGSIMPVVGDSDIDSELDPAAYDQDEPLNF